MADTDKSTVSAGAPDTLDARLGRWISIARDRGRFAFTEGDWLSLETVLLDARIHCRAANEEIDRHVNLSNDQSKSTPHERAREVAAQLIAHTTSVHNVDLIASAIAAERERCAKIVRSRIPIPQMLEAIKNG